MKKIKYILIVALFMVFTSINKVSAVTTCEYSFNSENDIIVTYDEGGTPSITQSLYDYVETPSILPLYSQNTGKIASDTVSQLKELVGKCPSSLYVCTYEEAAFGTGIKRALTDRTIAGWSVVKKMYIYSSAKAFKEENPELAALANRTELTGSDYADDPKNAFHNCSKDWDLWILDEIVGAGCWLASAASTPIQNFIDKDIYYTKYKDCKIVKYQGKNETYNTACPNLVPFETRFKEGIDAYTACGNDASCKSQAMGEINSQENSIKTYCKELLSHYDYDSGTEEECLESCLDISSQLRQKKINAGIISADTGKCGFSERIINWINNILKWIKYILPVLVIVLSILDFIKAIAADKDDEMKKAQQKFIRRLIVAALAFIVPLIIEFILEKMGFVSESCGLW